MTRLLKCPLCDIEIEVQGFFLPIDTGTCQHCKSNFKIKRAIDAYESLSERVQEDTNAQHIEALLE